MSNAKKNYLYREYHSLLESAYFEEELGNHRTAEQLYQAADELYWEAAMQGVYLD